MKNLLQKTIKFTTNLIGGLIALICIYLIFSIVLSVIPVNKSHLQKDEYKIDIFIKTNGVHLDIVLPLQNEIKDWTTDLHISPDIENKVNYASFGWGDKGFFINTPQWSDLTFSTSIKAIFLKSPAAIHVDYYVLMKTEKKCKRISISQQQYSLIVQYIEQYFKRDPIGKPILIHGLNYSSFDCFYEAKGTYNLFFTCNSWSNKALKEAGIRASLWTPFDKGTLFHYRNSKYLKQYTLKSVK